MKGDLLVVTVLATLPYLNSVFWGFVLDDTRAIVENADLRPEAPLAQVFENDFWGTPIASNASHKSYRPLTVLTFKATYHAAGSSPLAFHAGNVALYAAACGAWLVFLRGLGVLSRKGVLVASLAFALHPVHAESVASVVGRADMLCFVFFAGSIHYYLKAARDSCFYANYALAAILCGCALLSKEVGIVTFAAGAAFDLILCGRVLTFPLHTRVLFPALCRTFYSFVFSVGLLYVSVQIRGSRLSPSMAFVDNPIMFEESVVDRFLHYTYVHSWYLLLLACPLWSCSDWGYNVLPYPGTPLPALAAYAAVFGVPMLAVARRWEAREGVCLALVLTVLPLLPAAGFVPVGTVLAERLLFIPSAGFALGVGLAFDACLARVRPATRGLYAAVFALFAAYAFLAHLNSSHWESPTTLFSHCVEHCPASAKAHFSLGVAHMQNNDAARAVPHFKQALDIHPDYPDALVAFGRLARDGGQLEEAVALLERAVAVEKHHPDAHHHLGVAKAQLGAAEEGVGHLEKAIRLTAQLRLPQRTGDLWANYGTALAMAERLPEAAHAIKRAIALGGDARQRCSWTRNIFLVYQQDNRLAEAKQYLTVILTDRTCPLSTSDRAHYLQELDHINNAIS
ncbi:Transmembrane and TPR repeat-containing protein [Diplonema papillatum]|nr:Transmembrane and TPR repeat-containing protein [Diplonema papillatum]